MGLGVGGGRVGAHQGYKLCLTCVCTDQGGQKKDTVGKNHDLNTVVQISKKGAGRDCIPYKSSFSH